MLELHSKTYPDLLQLRFLESKIKAVVNETANLLRSTVVASTDDGNLCLFNKHNQLGNAPSVIIP